MILGTDGSRYCRLGEHFYYEIGGHRGTIRNFSGKLYDGSRYIGDYINGGIYMPSLSWIKIAGQRIYTAQGQYEFVPGEETLGSVDKLWFGVNNSWDALRIVLKDLIG